jgi:uncharacterized protein YndB with AHSA1/START domain
VYRAWLDPALLARWMTPDLAGSSRAEVDERVGGRFRIITADGGGFEAELLELDPDRRLVLRWGFVGPQRLDGPVFDSLLTITLAEAAGGTVLTLVHERLDQLTAALPQVAAQVENGWAAALANLAEVAW